jgi:lipoyl-dependent peroxiredoxin
MITYQETNAVTGSTQEVMKAQYTAKTHTSGGRRGGVSRSDDGRLDVKFSAPGVPGTGTNPEQLFAAGWAACFISAMGLVANKMKVKLPADAAIDAEIDLCNSGDVYFLRARLNVSLPGLEREVAQAHCGRHAPRNMCILQRYTGQHRRYGQRGVSRTCNRPFYKDYVGSRGV